MKKRIISMLTVIAMVTAFLPVISVPAMAADEWDGTADTSWYNESGTSFTISTPAELAGLASIVNGGTTFKNKTIRLTDDLDLGSKEWTPIGGETYLKAFQGTFDGGGHTISNVSISSSAFNFIGLFGVVSGGVKNLTVEPVTVTVPEEKYGGIIAGYVYGGKLFDCHTVGGTISGDKNSSLGGITGYGASSSGGTGGTITLCSNDGTAVTHTIKSVAGYAGGIVGYNNSGCKVTGCYNTGYITGGYLAGGIVGLNSGTVSHSYNTGNVKSLDGISPAAGICGSTLSGVATTYCHNYGDIADTSRSYLGIGTTQTSGGSSVYGTISNCYYLNGTNYAQDSNSKQLTEDEFESLDNFVGWADTGCWKMDSDAPSYPVLNPEAFYDYAINLYIYSVDDYLGTAGYELEETVYKNSGDYLTLADLDSFAKFYTLWTTDNNDFSDTSKHKTIDENGFLVTESMDLYAVDTVKSDAEYVTTGETYYAIAGTAKEFDLTELLELGADSVGVEFTITSGGAEDKVYIDSNKQTLKIAADADAGIYNLNITAEKKTVYERGEIMLMSVVDFDENDLANFTLTVKVIDLQGDGTEETPYLIPSALTLEYVRDKINADTAGSEWANKYYALTADINLNGSESNQWTPIGNSLVYFTGHFDGHGHTVSGLYINNNTADYQGLFGYGTGQIKNLLVEGTVTGRDYVGGIAGYAYGNNNIITACANKAAVSGNNYVGGIAGEAYQVTHSYNTGNVTGTGEYAGAITGYCWLYSDHSFYLENKANKCDGNIAADAYGKVDLSEDLFKSGYVAYILNDHTTDSEPPAQYIWGQKLGTDDYPVFLTDDNREGSTVYSASFMRSFDAGRWSYDADLVQNDPSMTPPETMFIDYTLANKGSRFSLTPLLESEDQQEEFNAADAWVLDTADINDTDKYITDADDDALICTGKDIALYAVEDINNAKTASDGSVTLIKSASAQNIDLKQYIGAGGDETLNANLTFKITGANPLTGATVEDNNLVIPANAAGGNYVFNITATKQPVFSLMSTDFSNGTASFALTVTVIDLGENANGSAEHPYQIPDAATLAYVRDKINAADAGFISAHYELTDNIGLNNENWTPIGTYGNKFSGTFDGKGYTISGFKIEKSGTAAGDDTMIGFFKIIGENGVVKNLTLKGEINVTITNASATGAIAGVNEGTITGCHSDVNITSTGFVGGIAGQFSSGGSSLSNTITNCYNTGSITAKSDYACAGGIVGFVGSSNLGVGYCYNTGNLSTTGTGASEDGIIGLAYGCQTARNYYLEGTALSDYGTEKTSAQFASGEVTWLMQSVQSAQAWGQNLSESGDAYPILTSEADKKVYKIEFKKKDGEGYTSAAADAYVNSVGIAELPSATIESDSHIFSHWTLDTNTKAEYKAGTAVTSNIVLYAVGEEKYGDNGNTHAITTTYGTAKTQDLSEFVTFATTDGNNRTQTAGSFNYSIEDGNEKLQAAVSNDTITIPDDAPAGNYTITIRASKKTETDVFKLMSVTLGNEAFTFDVEVTVNKANQTIAAPTASNVGAVNVTLDTVTGGVNGVKYAVNTENTAPTDADKWQESPTFTGLTKNTTYYFFAKYNENGNYNEAVSEGTKVTTADHTHEWEYTVSGATITATCKNTDDACSDTDGGSVTLTAPTEKLVYNTESHNASISGELKTGDTVTVKYEYKAAADGSYAETNTTVNAGFYKASITLDTDKTISVEYQIAKATPEYTEPTTPQSATYGDTLGGLTLPAGFVWDKGDNESVGNVGNNSFNVTFTPNDTVNYNTVQKTITVNVSALPETIIDKDDITIDFRNETIGDFTNGTYIITADGGSTEIAVTDGTIPIDNNYFGEDITIVKKAEDANHANSSPLAISISARPSKPSGVEVTKATDDNAANGKITGVDDTMEYKAADDETWTQIDGNEITELLPGTYYVRVAPTDNAFASETVTAVIGVMDKVTVVFIDGDGNTLDTQIVAPYTTVTYDGDTPTKTATAQFTYEFTDWDKEVGLVTEDTTFTAQFEEHLRSYTVTLHENGGTITGDFDSYTYGTALTLPTAEQITKDGSTFIGWYDNDEFEGEVVTEISADATGNKEYFARWKLNGTTTSEVIDNSGSSAKVEVENLEKIAEELSENIEGDVEVVLEITKENADSESAEQAAIEAIKTTNTVEYYDIALLVNTEKQATTPKAVSIKIPYDTTRVNITVYRYDAAATAKAITLSVVDTDSEYYEISDGYITIHTNSFATYAIGYDAPAATDTPRRSGGGSSRAKATPTPSPSAIPEPTTEPEGTPSPEPTETPSDVWWYVDVPETEWYYEPVKAVTDKGLMTGVWNGENADEFQPDFEISRAMFITVIYRIAGEPKADLDYTFEDILKDWYYEKAVAWGSANGIIAGYDEKTFAPDDKITREQMAAMLWRYAKYKGIDISIGEDTNILSFNDAGNITEYAIPAIQWACGADIISGYTDNTLRPQSNATRAQAAVVFDKIDDIINQ